MVFEDRFKNHILPDKVHMLNVAFLVPHMRRDFGGCAGNISYNLALLGDTPLPMAAVGKDFAPYADRLDKLGISRKHVLQLDDCFTAQAFITTDLDDNQITAFHPGAMMNSHRNNVTDAADIRIGIVAPDGRDAMIKHARDFASAGTPFIFDPGQGLPLFDGDDLKAFIEQATYVTVNDYESELIKSRTGYSDRDIANRVDAFIITRGGEGSSIYAGTDEITIPAADVGPLADPTGCGDAYRAGLLHGLLHNLDWDQTGRVASLMGAIKIEHKGTQNHSFTRDEFAERYQKTFDQPLP